MRKLINWVRWFFKGVFGISESSQEAPSVTPNEEGLEELRQIRANLADIPESERLEWAQRVFNRCVYDLHNARDPRRVLELLKMAAALRDEYILRIENEYYWSKLVQFVRYNTQGSATLPSEALVLVKYLAMPTIPVLSDFLREEVAKLKLLGWQGHYIMEHIHPLVEAEHASVRQQDEPPSEDDGFNPLDPKTYKR